MNNQNRIGTDNINVWNSVAEYIEKNYGFKRTELSEDESEIRIDECRRIRFRPKVGIMFECRFASEQQDEMNDRIRMTIAWWLDKFNANIERLENEYGGFHNIRLPEDFKVQ